MIRTPWSLLSAAVMTALSPALVAPARADDAGALAEVIVTAQKRAQNAQEVGISVSAVSGADLQALGAVVATDITKSMPAVILTQPNGPSSFSLSIRGVTQNDFADHQESPAAVYVDDVYVSQMAGLAFSLFDTDRVEVLRGPQGTLFGRNATGGLAHFVSRRPSAETGGYFDLTVGERNLTRVEGAATGRLFDGVDGRLAFQSNHYDPLFKHVGNAAGSDSENGNDWGLRGQLLFHVDDHSQLLLIGRGAREDVRAGAWETRATKFTDVPGVTTFVAPGELAYPTAYLFKNAVGQDSAPIGPGCAGCNYSGFPNSGDFRTSGNFAGYARIKTYGLTAKYTRDFGSTDLTVIADYQKLTKDYAEDSDTTPLTVFQFFNGSDVKQQSIEARLHGKTGAIDWTAGLYALKIDGTYFEGWTGPTFFGAKEFVTPANPTGSWPYNVVPGPDGTAPVTRSPYSLTTKSTAAFAQAEYRLNDLIGFTLGARFSTDKKDYQFTWGPQLVNLNSAAAPSPLTRVDGLALYDYAGNRDDKFWSGKASVDFHIAPDLLAYVSYNRGVKGGAFNAPLFPSFITDASLISIRPEKLTSYEAGFKSEFWGRRARLNGAAYYYDYKDYQALTYINLEQLIRNADAKHKGAELEFEVAATEQLRIGLGAAYVDAVVYDVNARGVYDANGKDVVGNFTPGNAPKWSGNWMIRYSWPVGAGHLAGCSGPWP